jgi:hypothetical protein
MFWRAITTHKTNIIFSPEEGKTNGLGYRSTNCNSNGYSYSMKVYNDNYKETLTGQWWTQLHMDNLLSSPDLCDNLHTGKIQCCGPMK